MIPFLPLKAVHIVSSTILFGTGLGIAFFKWAVDRSGNVAAIRVVSERVVLADWLFTSPAIVVQAATGIALARSMGFPLTHGRVAYTIGLYFVAGACWIPVVWLQMRMRDLARQSDADGIPLTGAYWRYARVWFWLGLPAFLSLIVIFWVMVAKPP